ncbi:hypothetical protein CEXT_504521 [Caerostris extrusa]|uniref:Uncharacterized protein n=1 Tax=Caerostris extrusa TaxID=172846 RepID=A0AAV4Y596_CAEEX|nr:hypothetical protein CEXT_504521 [Caerostris extrusa]
MLILLATLSIKLKLRSSISREGSFVPYLRVKLSDEAMIQVQVEDALRLSAERVRGNPFDWVERELQRVQSPTYCPAALRSSPRCCCSSRRCSGNKNCNYLSDVWNKMDVKYILHI